MDTGSSSNRPPRLRRKSSAFKLSLSRSSQSSVYSGAPPTPSLPTTTNSDSETTQDFTFLVPSPAASSPTHPLESPIMSTAPPPPPSTTTTTTTTTTNPMSTSSPSNGANSINSFPNVPSPSLNSTLDLLKQLVQKRLTAWNYLKNVSQGKIYWFNTILLTSLELKKFFPNEKMRGRTCRFTVLSMSLSSILEINQQPNDFLRGLLNLVQEFEQIPEDKFVGLSNTTTSGSSSGLGFTVGGGGGGGSGGASSSGSGKGQKSLFKLSSNKSKSKSSATSSTGGGGGGITANSGIVNSAGIISNATTGGIASSGAASGGGGADFAFGEGSESGYLFIPNIPFELDYLQVLTTTCDLLIQVYTKIQFYLGGSNATSGSHSTSSGALSQGLAEVVLKIDGKLKKLIGLLSKEIDNVARIAIKNELDILGGGVEGWGFETLSSSSTVGSGSVMAGGGG